MSEVESPVTHEQPAAAEPPEQPHPPVYSEGPLSMLQQLALTVAIAVFVITFLVQAFQIPSQSMENTLLIGDYLLVDKVHFADGGFWGHLLPYSPIQRGDIIVFRYPVDPQQHFVKRVIAVPGDRLRLVNKHVEVNGKLVDEDYVIHKQSDVDAYRDNFPRGNGRSSLVESRWYLEMENRVYQGELFVPNGQYFVMGDNRDESLDSRYWGFVPRENIIGRPLVIYLSLQQLRSEQDARMGLLGALSHVFHMARWDRSFRLVR